MHDFYRGKWGTQFFISEKLDVNGASTHPLYKHLKQNSGLKGGDILWNYEKFLADANGQITNYYLPSTPPNSILGDIQKLLTSSLI